MEELTRLAELVRIRPGITTLELRDTLRREGRSSITSADVERALGSAVALFRSDVGQRRRWWPTVVADGAEASGEECVATAPSIPTSRLPPLYAWQQRALHAWRAAGHRGVIEAVTGTGKTVVGLAAAEEELARRGQVAVIVPTRELMAQWARLLPPVLPHGATVGLLGDRSRDGLRRHDIVVAVVNSARTADLYPRRPGGLLIADECHRYGSEQNRLVLHDGFPRRLGLSATFARPDDAHEARLRPYFGGVRYRFGYQDARREGVIAPFDVILVMVDLAPNERAVYDEATHRMAAARAQLIARSLVPTEPVGAFLPALVALARGDDDDAATARAYLRAMQDRRHQLDAASAKLDALGQIATVAAGAGGRADRTIVFTQSIEAAEDAASVLGTAGCRAAALHSGLRARDRRALMQRFRDGSLDALTAPQVLDEGIDVPEADLGVVLGASRSRRQMVQRMGRVLRRKSDARRARFVVVSALDTIEDPRTGAHEAFLDEVVPVARRMETVVLGGSDLAAALRR